MNKYIERIYNGILKENPVLILMLGMCPALAVSTRATNGLGMGLSTTAVLIMSNLVISLLRKVIPNEVRLPAYIVVVASLVTVTELLIEAYLPGLYDALGIYIPLIVVNCIILGRAEAYAGKNPPEVLGNGTAFGFRVLPESAEPIAIFIQPPGAFLIIAVIIMVMNAIGIRTRQRQLVEEGCGGSCANCTAACGRREEASK